MATAGAVELHETGRPAWESGYQMPGVIDGSIDIQQKQWIDFGELDVTSCCSQSVTWMAWVYVDSFWNSAYPNDHWFLSIQQPGWPYRHRVKLYADYSGTTDVYNAVFESPDSSGNYLAMDDGTHLQEQTARPRL